MVARGLSSLDELEESDRQESEAVVEAQASGALDVVDWSVVFGDSSSLDLLADPGSSGGTLPVSQGNGGS
jgi:hypothetical protein